MNQEPLNSREPSKQLARLTGSVRDFLMQFKVAWRLLWDGRVPLSTKLIPALTAAYVLFPLDLMPDVALGFGQLDDLAVVLIGLRMFLEFCPPAVVQEHKAASVPGTARQHPWTAAGADAAPEGPVIDLFGEFVDDEDDEDVTG